MSESVDADGETTVTDAYPGSSERDERAVTTRTSTVEEATTTDAEGRWFAGLLVALAAGSAGIFRSSTGVFLAGIVGLVYAGYASLSRPPAAALVVERTVEPAAPKPGDRVAVTVRAENVDSAPIADLRLADDPPDGLEVVDGEARAAGTVESGDELVVSYELRAVRGRHEFGDVVAVARGASGEGVRRTVYGAAEPLVCRAPFESLELAGQTGIGAGRVETDSGGEGVEFYATREYARGDPASRVDWNRYATTGELTTVTYRESKAATVTLVVDGRFDHRRAPGDPNARERCGYATVRIADALLDAQNQVGAAVFAGNSSGALRVRGVLDPARGAEQSLRVRALLRTRLGVSVDEMTVDADRGSAGASERSDLGESGRSGPGGRVRRDAGRTGRLVDRVPGGAQVVFVTPLLDDVAVQAVEALAAREHVTTVVSPDVTTGSTPGGTVERVVRAARCRAITGTDRVRLVDWSPEEPLQAAVDRASARWDA